MRAKEQNAALMEEVLSANRADKIDIELEREQLLDERKRIVDAAQTTSQSDNNENSATAKD